MPKMKTKKSEKIQIEFEEEHLHVLIVALETYSRLQSGQISYAMDTVYADRDLSYDERQYLENVIRYIAFPSNPRREYDGHGGFYDQYNNEYDEGGNIINESDEWKRLKNRPHLDHPNSSFGVGCKETKHGTMAFEIRKVIDQYFHYKRNNGYRKICDVSGDGMKWSYSGVPAPKVVGFEPSLSFNIPKKYHKKVTNLFDSQKYEEMWKYIDTVVFKNKPLPKGSCSKFSKKGDDWCIIVEEPYKL
jgi:hypothetical protein